MLGSVTLPRSLPLRGPFCAGLFAALSLQAEAQGIYTCVDAKGRRLTSDRPIAECNDRVQRELNPTGTVKREIKPVPTAEERAAQEARAREEAEQRQQQAEQRRRERALLARYPNQAAHDKERNAALASVDESLKAATARTASLQAQRKKLDTEAEFYKGDASKYPPALKRQLEEYQQQVAAQQRYVSEREQEKKRIHERFDGELTQLRKLWGPASPATAAASR